RGRGSRRRNPPLSDDARSGERDLQRRCDRVRNRARRPRCVDRARRLVVTLAARAGEAGGARAARARAVASVSARGVALQDRAQGFVRRRLESATPARLAAAALESRGADRDLRLVPREPGPRFRGRCHAPRAMEPAGAAAAEEDLLMLVLNAAEVRELLDLDRLVDALADAHADLT